jgi:hypothetical protein
MNKKRQKISIWVIIFILGVLVLSLFLMPKIKELNIKSKIEKANYCEIDSDCVDVGGKCPFGCYIYVNKNEVSEISSLVESFDSNCVYGCLACPTVTCENKKCKEVCE